MNTPHQPKRSIITDWQPENALFWEQKGKHIANRNLWISIPCLLLSFCIWMLFSAVAIKLNAIGFNFTTNQLFFLTAIPSISGALLRVPYSFVIPIFGGRRWTAFSTLILIVPCIWLGIAVQDTSTSYSVFVVIALLCGVAGANFASSMSNISFFYPKKQQGKALGLNGGLGNLGVSVMQLVSPVVATLPIFAFISTHQQLNSDVYWLQNMAYIWVIPLLVFAILSYLFMNDLSSSQASLKAQLPVLKNGHMWVLSLLYLATFGSFIGFAAGFAMLSKTQFPAIDITTYAFFGPFIGAIARPIGGTLSDKFNGIRMTILNYLLMIMFVIFLFFTLPHQDNEGSFIAFYLLFLGLFFTAGFGSGSTYQMISVVFRRIVHNKLTQTGVQETDAQKSATTETAAALGFISAIGAMGGFLIPQTFGLSLSITHSASTAMYLFLGFYVLCLLITWLFYARKFK